MNRMLAICYDWLLCQFGFNGDWSRFTFDEKRVSLLAIALHPALRLVVLTPGLSIVTPSADFGSSISPITKVSETKNAQLDNMLLLFLHSKKRNWSTWQGSALAYIARTRAESFRTVLSLT